MSNDRKTRPFTQHNVVQTLFSSLCESVTPKLFAGAAFLVLVLPASAQITNPAPLEIRLRGVSHGVSFLQARGALVAPSPLRGVVEFYSSTGERLQPEIVSGDSTNVIEGGMKY